MSDTPNIDAAAARIILALAEWIENARCSKQASEMTVDKLLADFAWQFVT